MRVWIHSGQKRGVGWFRRGRDGHENIFEIYVWIIVFATFDYLLKIWKRVQGIHQGITLQSIQNNDKDFWLLVCFYFYV